MEKKLTLDERLDLEGELIDVIYDTFNTVLRDGGERVGPADYLEAVIDLLREKGVL